MSEKYLIVGEPEQGLPYDPQAMAEGLGLTWLGFLGPLLLDRDQWLDKRLIRTFVQAIEAMLTFRDRLHGLVFSELGSSLDPIGKGVPAVNVSWQGRSPLALALDAKRARVEKTSNESRSRRPAASVGATLAWRNESRRFSPPPLPPRFW